MLAWKVPRGAWARDGNFRGVLFCLGRSRDPRAFEIFVQFPTAATRTPRFCLTGGGCSVGKLLPEPQVYRYRVIYTGTGLDALIVYNPVRRLYPYAGNGTGSPLVEMRFTGKDPEEAVRAWSISREISLLPTVTPPPRVRYVYMG